MKMKGNLKIVAAIRVVMVSAMSCSKPDGPNDNGNEVSGNASLIVSHVHEWVDLGLPSGTLWAACNVGADAPEDFGDYFAWGETMPKSIYNWNEYKYGDFIDNRYEFTKYCPDSLFGLNGFVDSLIVLELCDDAARVNWGADWRMPTGEEWEELFNKTTFEWTDLNGVKGWCFTGFNGNSIFLPSAGYWWGDTFNSNGGSIYWSSTLNTTYPNRAWSFYSNSDNFHLCGSNERNNGHVVRAVRSTK